jgi:hypothetical protein
LTSYRSNTTLRDLGPTPSPDQLVTLTTNTPSSEHGSSTLDVGYYSSEARTSIILLSPVLTIRARCTIDTNLLPAVENLDSWHLKLTSIASKVRFDGMTTSQAPRLYTKLLLGISPVRGLHLKDNFSRLRSLSSSGAPHQQLLDMAHMALLSWGLHAARVLG